MPAGASGASGFPDAKEDPESSLYIPAHITDGRIRAAIEPVGSTAPAIMQSIDYDAILGSVIATSHHRHAYSVHGPDHWRRVERNACVLAARTGAIVPVVRLFALFHDSRRENDGHDPDHGKRGAEFAAKVRGTWFDLPDDQFALLHYACVWHTDGHHHDDPTVGTCWDADRLDLGRVGMTPHPSYMSTKFGAEIAENGTIQPWLHLALPHIPFPETHHHLG